MSTQIHAIRTEADYVEALARVGVLMDSEVQAENSDELDLLVVLVDDYETEHYPIAQPTAAQMLRHIMDARDLKTTDLVPYIGPANRVNEVLTGKRSLTPAMIERLCEGLNINLDYFK